MAKAAVLASGNGSNFQAIAEAVLPAGHEISVMICDRKEAGCYARAEKLGVPRRHISYKDRTSREAEEEILGELASGEVRIVFLAGFMRILTPFFLDSFPGEVINIHPSLLPRYPGAHGIRDSFLSGDRELGITIHKVDPGIDTGPVIRQASFTRRGDESLEDIEARIHQLEHYWYPRVALELLDGLDRNGPRP